MAQKLLFVDSSASHALTFECFFRDAGFDVISVTSCLDAFIIMENFDFDLIISDFDCPALDGNTLVDKAAARPRPIPVIGFASDMHLVKPSPLIKEVVLKPASIFELSDAIDRTLSMPVC
jgi:CheY-like chemotaxis protein